MQRRVQDARAKVYDNWRKVNPPMTKTRNGAAHLKRQGSAQAGLILMSKNRSTS